MENYVLRFSEIANDLRMELASVFNVSSEKSVSVIVTSENGLLPGRQYSITVFAANSAGESSSVITACKWRLQYAALMCRGSLCL